MKGTMCMKRSSLGEIGLNVLWAWVCGGGCGLWKEEEEETEEVLRVAGLNGLCRFTGDSEDKSCTGGKWRNRLAGASAQLLMFEAHRTSHSTKTWVWSSCKALRWLYHLIWPQCDVEVEFLEVSIIELVLWRSSNNPNRVLAVSSNLSKRCVCRMNLVAWLKAKPFQSLS